MNDGFVTIRRATEDDANTIHVVLTAAFAPYRTAYTAGAYQATVLTPEVARLRVREMTVLLAVAPTTEVIGTIGYARVNTGEGRLRGMAVNPRWEGTGTGHALLSAALAGLDEAGCSRVTLETTAPLRRAIAFYQSQGFHPTGRVTDFLGMPLYQYLRSNQTGIAGRRVRSGLLDSGRRRSPADRLAREYPFDQLGVPHHRGAPDQDVDDPL